MFSKVSLSNVSFNGAAATSVEELGSIFVTTTIAPSIATVVCMIFTWVKYGNVYLIFPIDELSVQIGKCKSSVKTALKELDEVGLLVRRSGGFSKPNHLYVKIPSDEIGLQTVDDKAVEKMALMESEKQPSSGRKNGCTGVGKADVR